MDTPKPSVPQIGMPDADVELQELADEPDEPDVDGDLDEQEEPGDLPI